MLWENLRVTQFNEWIEKSRGVCVLPIGVLEKHGDHLPVGTDMFVARAVCERAAEIEPAVVFPYYFLGQISEARHYKGAIAASGQLRTDILLEMCDEIARNGFKKILIVNSHGGNRSFLSSFVGETRHLGRDYNVYYCQAGGFSEDQVKKICELAGTEKLGAHAGISETSLMLHLHPDLTNLSDQDPIEGESLDKLKTLEDLQIDTGINWYAKFPHHYAGAHTGANAGLGETAFEMMCANTAKRIRAVKEDSVTAELFGEFFTRARDPE